MSSKHTNFRYNVTLPPPLTVWNASHMIKVLCNPNPYATTVMLLCFTCAQYLTSPSHTFYKVCSNSLICSKTLKVCNLILQCCKCPKVKYMCSYIQNIIALWLQIYILLPSSSFGFSVTWSWTLSSSLVVCLPRWQSWRYHSKLRLEWVVRPIWLWPLSVNVMKKCCHLNFNLCMCLWASSDISLWI